MTYVLAALCVLLPLAALLAYRWGYREGHRAGLRELDQYKQGQVADGGCWVRAQNDSIPPPPG